MKFSSKIMVPVLSALLLVSSGCAPRLDVAADLAAVSQDYQLKWEAGTENSLLPYIPEDSKVVFCTVRQFDASYSGFRHWQQELARFLDKKIAEDEEYIEYAEQDYKDDYEEYIECPKRCVKLNDEREAEKAKKLLLHKIEEDTIGMSLIQEEDDDDDYNECDACPDEPERDARVDKHRQHLASLKNFKDLILDYESHASDLGLDSKGRMDAVLYVHGTTPVFKMTVQNAEKFQIMLENKLSEKFGEHFVKEDLIAGEDKWTRYIFEGNSLWGRGKSNDAIVAYYTRGMVTFSVVSSRNFEVLPSLIRYAKKPFVFKTLGKVSKNTFLAGYIDNKSLLQTIFAQPSLNAILMSEKVGYKRWNDYDDEFDFDDEDRLMIESMFSEMCQNEYLELSKDLKEHYMRFELKEDGELGLEYLLSLNDKELFNKYKSFYQPSYPIEVGTDVMMSILVSMDFGKMYSEIKDRMKNLKNRRFKCEELSEVSEYADEFLDDISKFERSKDLEDIVEMIRDVKSIHFVMGKDDEKTMAFHVVGESMGALKHFIKDVLDVENLRKDEVTHFKDGRLKLDMLLKDESFSAGTSEFDVSEMSGTKPVIDQKFIRFSLPSGIFFKIFDLKHSLNADFGTTDKEFVLHLSIK